MRNIRCQHFTKLCTTVLFIGINVSLSAKTLDTSWKVQSYRSNHISALKNGQLRIWSDSDLKKSWTIKTPAFSKFSHSKIAPEGKLILATDETQNETEFSVGIYSLKTGSLKVQRTKYRSFLDFFWIDHCHYAVITLDHNPSPESTQTSSIQEATQLHVRGIDSRLASELGIECIQRQIDQKISSAEHAVFLRKNSLGEYNAFYKSGGRATWHWLGRDTLNKISLSSFPYLVFNRKTSPRVLRRVRVPTKHALFEASHLDGEIVAEDISYFATSPSTSKVFAIQNSKAKIFDFSRIKNSFQKISEFNKTNSAQFIIPHFEGGKSLVGTDQGSIYKWNLSDH